MFFFIIYICMIYSSYINADGNLRGAFLPFGNLTIQFLSSIQPNDGLNLSMSYLPQIIGKSPLSLDIMEYVNFFWKTYVGYMILIIIGLVFIFIFTLVGLCFCCCRCCCNRCGVKPPGASKTNTKRKRILLNVMLFLFTTMILIGSIVSMASNVILLDAIKPTNDTSDKVGNILANIDIIFQNAINYINYVATNAQTNGYTVLQNTLNSIVSVLSGTINLFINTFLNQLNYNLVINATNTVINSYSGITVAGQILANISTLHQSMANTFNIYLNNVVKNLTTILNGTACQNYTSNCQVVSVQLENLILGFNISNINYTVDQNIPNVTNAYNISDMSNAMNFVKASVLNVTSQINSTVSGYIQSFANSLSTNSTIFATFNSSISYKSVVIDFITQFRNTLFSLKPDNGKAIQDGFVYNYYRYAFYGFIVLNGIILIVVLLFYVGLCYGMCGGPNFEDSPRCSKGAGSGYLMGSVTISFIFGWFIMLIVMIMFIVGGLIQTESCSYLTNIPTQKPLATVDRIINTSLTLLNITIPINNVKLSLPNINYMQSVLTQCSSSPDLISAFQLPPYYISQVSNIFYQEFVASQLTNLIQQIRRYAIPSIEVGSLQNSSSQLTPVITTLIGVNSTATLIELAKPVVVMPSVTSFLNAISDLSQISNGTHPQFASSLNATTNQLASSITNMTNIQNAYFQQKTLFASSVKSLSAQSSSLINTLSSLPSRTSDATTAAVSIANSSLGLNVSTLINATIFNMLISLGNCQGLATTVNAAISTLCTTFLIPFNNIWMGMGWFLIFIIPSMVVALKLHRLYRISHIETQTTEHSKAYQSTNRFLSENDKEKIRSLRYESHA